MDEMDLASDREERAREAALSFRMPDGPAPIGECLDPGCREPLSPGERFCDAECRDNYERTLRTRCAR